MTTSRTGRLGVSALASRTVSFRCPSGRSKVQSSKTSAGEDSTESTVQPRESRAVKENCVASVVRNSAATRLLILPSPNSVAVAVRTCKRRALGQHQLHGGVGGEVFELRRFAALRRRQRTDARLPAADRQELLGQQWGRDQERGLALLPEHAFGIDPRQPPGLADQQRGQRPQAQHAPAVADRRRQRQDDCVSGLPRRRDDRPGRAPLRRKVQ